MAPNPPPQREKPLLRGYSHEIAAYVAVPAVLALVAGARGSVALSGAVAYGASLVFLFSTSALYHRPRWSPAARRILWRLDHAAIFVLIAGTYTPLCLVVGPGTGHALLAVVWTGAVAGVIISMVWVTAPKPLMAGLYVLLGWVATAGFRAMYAVLGARALLVLLAGGLLYTAGAVIYALRRPDPMPSVFGFHEIFHLLVVAAAACHFAVVAWALRALPAG
jgi:hemolysin III